MSRFCFLRGADRLVAISHHDGRYDVSARFAEAMELNGTVVAGLSAGMIFSGAIAIATRPDALLSMPAV